MTHAFPPQSDRGNITLLSLGFAVFAILLILVGAAVTGVHLDRTRLQHIADELALDAADAMDTGAYYTGLAPRPTSEAGIAVSVVNAGRVASSRLPGLEAQYGMDGVTLVEVTSLDGHTVTVTVTVVVHPLFGSSGWLPLGDITLTATASARVH
ncbi:MAG: Tad domain-containing protein [Demequinaceae bacterium]|nr:Tad domain-containing protein [Demequinaceae bacterium]